MAILFDCPYCTAPIKVADAAAGKVGRCPKCETKLTVPIPPRKPVTAKPPQVTGDVGALPRKEVVPAAPEDANQVNHGVSSEPKPPSVPQAKRPPAPLPPLVVVDSESAEDPPLEPGFIPAPGSFLQTRGHHASIKPKGAGESSESEPQDFNFLDGAQSASANSAAPQFSFDEGGDAVSQFPVVQSAENSGFPAISSTSTGDPVMSTFAARVKSQHKTAWGRMIIPLFLGVGLLVAGGVTYLATRTTFTGAIDGEILQENVPFVVEIDRSRFGLPSDRVERMLAEFRNEPRELNKNIGALSFGAVRFEGQEQGLIITQIPGPDVRVIRVDLRSNTPLMEFVKEHAFRLDEPRQRILRREIEKFARDWDTATSAGMNMGNLGDFQEVLGREAMSGSLGHHVVARVGVDSYLCTFQDADARLYFLLPKGVTEFDLVERSEVEGGDPVFPAKFEFRVTIVDPSKPQPERPASTTTSPTDQESPSPSVPATTDPADPTLSPGPMTPAMDKEMDSKMMST